MCKRTYFRDHRGEDASITIRLTIYSCVISSVVVPWSEAAAQNVVVSSEGRTIAWMLRILVQRNSTDCISNLTIHFINFKQFSGFIGLGLDIKIIS